MSPIKQRTTFMSSSETRMAINEMLKDKPNITWIQSQSMRVAF